MTLNSENLVHVNAYVKSDGTQVKDYYRSAPNRDCVNTDMNRNFPDRDCMDVPDELKNQRPVLWDCYSFKDFIRAFFHHDPVVDDCMNVPDEIKNKQPTLGDCFNVPDELKNLRPPLWDCVKFPKEAEKLNKELSHSSELSKKTYLNTMKQNSPVLEGGVSIYDVDNFNIENVFEAIVVAAIVAVEVSVKAIQLTSEIIKNSKLTENLSKMSKSLELEPQLDTTIKELKSTHEMSKKVEEQNLNLLINAKNQNEYSKLYETFTSQKDLNDKNTLTINRLDYAVKNKDYNAVIKELENYQSNFKDVVIKNKKLRPLNIEALLI